MVWSRVDAFAEELAATRAEVLGLVLLVLGGLVVSWLVVQRPPSMASTEPSADAATVSVASPTMPVDAIDGGDGEAPGTGTPAAGADRTSDPGGTANADDEVAPDRGTGGPIDGDGAVVVHVTGAVANPGVVALAPGDRVVDAVAAAGGPTDDAAVGALNMARPLRDGERILVPTPADVEAGLVPDPADPVPTSGGGDAGGSVGDAGVQGSGDANDAGGRLDLNRATSDDMQGLPGVGPVIAERIIAWRDANGGFDAVGQLREVAGIGEKTFQSLADLVVVQ